MRLSTSARLAATCSVVCLACSACGWNPEMDREAIGIVSSLWRVICFPIWLVCLSVPLIVFSATFGQSIPTSSYPAPYQLTRPAFAVAVTVLPNLLLWPLHSFYASVVTLFYACCVKYAHLIYLDGQNLKRRLEDNARQKAVEDERTARDARIVAQIHKLPSAKEFVAGFMTALRARCANETLAIPLEGNLYPAMIEQLYNEDILVLRPYNFDSIGTKYDDIPKLLNEFQEPLLSYIMEFRRLIPLTRQSFSAPAYNFFDLNGLHRIHYIFSGRSSYEKDRTHTALSKQLQYNWEAVSQERLSPREYEQGKRIFLPDSTALLGRPFNCTFAIPLCSIC